MTLIGQLIADMDLSMRSEAVFIQVQGGKTEKCLADLRGKEKAYRLLAILHNFPRVMHGSNLLNRNCHPISFQNARTYDREPFPIQWTAVQYHIS